ncbi:MAG: hypothetical protein GX801_11740 [Fibrobacter sp.]|nr:hypothetical protein [Fibrobacter sp.]
MKLSQLLVCALAISGAWASSVPHKYEPFSKEDLYRKNSLQLQNPKGFSMQQSYSMRFSGGSFGSTSAGVYLNTLSYEFNMPLTLSVDIGMYNMFHTSMQNPSMERYNQNFLSSKPQFLIPRIALDYQPTDKMSFSIQLLNTDHAYKAYGMDYWGYPRWRQR